MKQINSTGLLAQFVCNFNNHALTDEVVQQAKIAVADCLGVGIAGFKEPVSNILRDYLISMPAKAEATIWGTDFKIASFDAALVNGTASHALDYDDCNRSVLGHPSTVLVPVAFAVGEKENSSGRKLLEGYIVGFEVMARLGRVLNPGLYDRGWHPTSVLGIMGATAAAGYILGLNIEQTKNAIGIAASEASGIKKNFGSMTKPWHAGSAARKGIWAALLAERGLTADTQALNGNFGFFEIFKGEQGYDLQPLNNIGDPLEIVVSGLVIKRYPSCASFHPLLDGMIDIQQKEEIKPEEVKEIVCRLNPSRIPHIDKPEVKTGLEAKFSLQYSVAAALVDGKNSWRQYEDENIFRPEIRQLMPKVTIVADNSYHGYHSEITVITIDGQKISRVMSDAQGSPTLPLNEAELKQKFMDCTSTMLGISTSEQLWREIMKMEVQENLVKIRRLLAP